MELLLCFMTLAGISLIFHFDSSFRTGILFGVISVLLFACYAKLNGRIQSSDGTVNTTSLQMTGVTVGLGTLLPPSYNYFRLSISCLLHKKLFYHVLLAFGKCDRRLNVKVNNKPINKFTASTLQSVLLVKADLIFFHAMMGIRLNLPFILQHCPN